MNDTIYRQAAIDAIRASASKYTGFMEMEMYTDDDAVEAIEGLPSAQQEQRWIPCSGRLPEEEERSYWVCTDTGYQCQCRWTNDVYGFGVSDRWEWKIYDIPQYQKVVAWMSLPEPYREEGEHE